MEGKRIIGESAAISYERVHDFFEQRGNNPNLKHKYNSVLLLDDHPEIAVQRDRHSKKRIEELLDLSKGMTVLDIGCGIGRMGELFCGKGLSYYGIDGSATLIEKAERNLAEFDHKVLLVGKVQNLETTLRNANVAGTFDIVFLCGILMYLNDDDVKDLFAQIRKLTHPGSQICMIESMSEEKRLTLQDFYSDEIKQTYSAIYRSEKEFIHMMSECFSDRFSLVCNEVMDYPDGIQKKRDHVTLEHCIIWIRSAEASLF